jgi:hypothetical protein
MRLVRLLLVSPAARLSFTLVCGVLLNIAYVASNVVSAFIYHSVWAATVSIYHLILIVIRIYLLSERKMTDGKKNIDRLLFRVGVLLLFLDLVSGSMMVYTVRQGSFVRYSGIVLFAFVFYAVYSLFVSVRAVKVHNDDGNHLRFASRNISLSTSLMSVFNLQYSILSLLGADAILTARSILLGGISVFSVILFLSIRLIRKANKWAEK